MDRDAEIIAGAVNHAVDAAAMLEAALRTWWTGSRGDALAGIVSGVDLGAAMSGLNVDGDLVVVVPHSRTACQLALVHHEWDGLGLVDGSAPVQLLQARAAKPQRPGAFTLQLPVLESVPAYELLVGLLREQLLKIGHAAGRTTPA